MTVSVSVCVCAFLGSFQALLETKKKCQRRQSTNMEGCTKNKTTVFFNTAVPGSSCGGWVCVCVCLCVRACVRVCLCVRERGERERESCACACACAFASASANGEFLVTVLIFLFLCT